ncbi:MAG: LacI family DNA-binding transcriptional regulator [Flavobacteriaceae bacterium]|nr:LacI family transcriptional regulator [Bacteroidia bacterium]NNK87951.1 LacI family DNA-binding transcriptional regulator [Flavobacteriaceae bacterium]
MKRKITLKQIARELDVSVSTVSKALKDSDEISDDTKQKIQAFAKLYNYKPNNIALSLKNRKTKTIGVIIPEIVHYFFSKVIQGIENIALKHGYNVIIGVSNESFDNEVINIETLANGSIDGFILSLSKETLQKQDYHHLNETISQGMPVVLFDRVIDAIVCDKVIIDDINGAKEAIELLISKGCKRIAIITTEDYISVGRLRLEGYLRALNENEIESNDDLILKVDDRYESEDRLDLLDTAIERLLVNNPGIDGVLAVNELYAVSAMRVARKLGCKIPDEIQVIGFTNGVLSRHATPGLTTVAQNAQKIGEKAADLLIKRLETEQEEESYETSVIDTRLVIRESTK